MTTPKEDGKTAVHELVYHEIRQSLMVGTFAPGQKVSLRSLAEQVGTSLTPVRGAVNRLIAEGAFEIMPNRWVVIPSMTEDKFEEIIHWRIQLETAATRQACANLDKRVIKEIDSINRQMIKIAEEGRDRKELLSKNYDFHFNIYRKSNSKVLIPMIESLWLQCGPFTYFSLLSPKDFWDTKFHLDVIDALKEGDAEAAAKAIKSDILSTAKFLQEHGRYEQPKLNKILA